MTVPSGSCRSRHPFTPVQNVLSKWWLQPSGFTQNVPRIKGIISGQDVMLQSLGVITTHSPHDNAWTDQAQRGSKEPAQHQRRSMRVGAGRSKWPGLPWNVGVITPRRSGRPGQTYSPPSGDSRPAQSLDWYGVCSSLLAKYVERLLGRDDESNSGFTG